MSEGNRLKKTPENRKTAIPLIGGGRWGEIFCRITFTMSKAEGECRN